MSDDTKPALPPPETSRQGGKVTFIVTLVVLSVLAAAIGGGAGFLMLPGVEKMVLEKHQAKEEKRTVTGRYTGAIAMSKLAPVITNLASAENDWVRLEASIVYKNGSVKSTDVLESEIRQDSMAFLRSLSLAQIQGPSGLQHLREDLNERARIRSKGEVQELIIETLVVQ
jgi:flagellar FliL protein